MVRGSSSLNEHHLIPKMYGGTEKFVVMRRFFESIASRIRHIYDSAARDIEAWLRAVSSPIEGQVREYQAQLRRRLESVRRVLDASDSLEGRITELDEQRYRRLLAELEMVDLDYPFRVGEIQLITVAPNFDSTTLVRSFRLGASSHPIAGNRVRTSRDRSSTCMVRRRRTAPASIC